MGVCFRMHVCMCVRVLPSACVRVCRSIPIGVCGCVYKQMVVYGLHKRWWLVKLSFVVEQPVFCGWGS